MEKAVFYDEAICISSQENVLTGKMVIPDECQGIIIIVDDVGNVLQDNRSQHIARMLQGDGFATLQVDLSFKDETELAEGRQKSQDLARRIADVCKWAEDNPQTDELNVGIFCMNTSSAAALHALSEYRGNKVNTLISLGGRPDLALEQLKQITIPMLFITGKKDNANVVAHEKALEYFNANSKLDVLPDAGDGYADPKSLDKVLSLTRAWLITHL